jgi:hypothetical protein
LLAIAGSITGSHDDRSVPGNTGSFVPLYMYTCCDSSTQRLRAKLTLDLISGCMA